MTSHQRLLVQQILIAVAAILCVRATALVPTLLYAGVASLLFSLLLRNPWWWHVIHVIFLPMSWFASLAAVPPSYYLVGFLASLLIFYGAVRSRVPLYLTGHSQLEQLSNAMPIHTRRIADLGAGIGTVTVFLAKQHPNIAVHGYEVSPLTWLVGFLRTCRFKNIEWHFGSFDQAPLSDFDIVYAFLSPEPMPDLWRLATRYMQPGSLFISNTFPIPDHSPDQVLLNHTAHPLFIYRVTAQSESQIFRPPQLPVSDC